MNSCEEIPSGSKDTIKPTTKRADYQKFTEQTHRQTQIFRKKKKTELLSPLPSTNNKSPHKWFYGLYIKYVTNSEQEIAVVVVPVYLA